jgi:hypothetical protein
VQVDRRSNVLLAVVGSTSVDLSPESALAFVREELEELRGADQLGPHEVQWALEHLISSGVSLPDVLGVVFDFAEVQWLGELETDVASGFDAESMAALARQIGIDPNTGKRLTPLPRRSLLESLPPTSKVRRREASAAGCEGVRQRPLRGWQR